MSERGPRGRADSLDALVDVRVIRFEPGQKLYCRTLANSYKGCLVHHVKGRSEYCPGEEKCNNHKIPPQWKGYTPVEYWDPAQNLWFPGVLEITECLDSDMKPQFQRGQVWEIGKGKLEKKGKRPPVRGVLKECFDSPSWPEAFAMRAVLVRIYHYQDIRLDQDNPIPPRVMLAPSKPDPRPTSSAGPTSPKNDASILVDAAGIRARLQGRAKQPEVKE